MISENTKAIMLLTTYFNTKEVGNYKPFSVNKYGYFACWLNKNDFKPVELFSENKLVQLSELWDEPDSHLIAKEVIRFTRLENTISNITFDKIKALLSRGTSLSLALDKWQSAGVWIMDRQHPNYPKSFKKQLKHQTPALFFGVGNPELLSQPSIGFVGSRDCTSQDEQATNNYVEVINSLHYQVVSGAAKGIDSQAMLSSLNNGNTAIGILADSLFKTSASSQWRPHLKDNRLVLISPFYPEGRFTPANAMARNKFIYLSSKATVVVCSGEKGGTWEGAKENLKKDWVPLLVSTHQEPLQAGNLALIDGGGLGKTLAKAISLSPKTSLAQLIDKISGIGTTTETGTIEMISNEPVEHTQKDLSPLDQGDMFASQPSESSTLAIQSHAERDDKIQNLDKVSTSGSQNTNDIVPHTLSKDTQTNENDPLETDQQVQTEPNEMPVLEYFYTQLCNLISQQPMQTVDKELLDSYFPEFEIIGKTALDKWLKHFVEQGKLIKPNAKKKVYKMPKSDEL